MYLGYARGQAMEYKVKEFCKLISEFALEYKTVRDRLLQQQEKRANHRERHKTRGKMITEGGRFGKLENEFSNEVASFNGYANVNGLKPNLNGQHKTDEINMMEVLKNPTSDIGFKATNGCKPSSGHYGSVNNLAQAGGLPGVRGRTRMAAGSNGNISVNDRSSVCLGQSKTMTTDTEEDETVDFLLKSAMTVPKGQPPKKRTKKYGERKSCKLMIHSLLNTVSLS